MKLNALLSAGLLAAGAYATDQITPEKLENDIHKDRLENVLWNFNKIARDNGGNRAFGMPGYQASMDFVLERMQKRFGKHFDTKIQPFKHLFATTNSIKLTGPDSKDVKVASLIYNNPTPLPGGVTAAIAAIPVDDTRGSGCFEDQWAGIDVKDKIVLIKRGACAISQKLAFAKSKGALAAVLINNVPGEDISSATLGAENYGKISPVGVITLEQGNAWLDLVNKGEEVKVTLVVDAIAEERETWNIISETKEGDPNNVIVLGAHLDGAQEGPGINDDGSGSAALLEIAESVKKYTGIKNKIRFAWWGAEESGLVGSLHYTKTLTEKEADAIRFYYNYDMIGSKVPDYVVYANTDAHKTGGKHLFDYLGAKGYPAKYEEFSSNSDYVGFLELGIPSSGLFTGAGAPQDVCYHLPCDDLTNINWEALTVNTKAAAHTLGKLALSVEGIPPREKTTANPQSKRGVARSLTQWAAVAKEAKKTHACSGHAKETV